MTLLRIARQAELGEGQKIVKVRLPVWPVFCRELSTQCDSGKAWTFRCIRRAPTISGGVSPPCILGCGQEVHGKKLLLARVRGNVYCTDAHCFHMVSRGCDPCASGLGEKRD